MMLYTKLAENDKASSALLN